MDEKTIKQEEVHEKFDEGKKKRKYLIEYGIIQDLISDEIKKRIEEKSRRKQKMYLDDVDPLTEILELYDGSRTYSEMPFDPNRRTSSNVEDSAIRLQEIESGTNLDRYFCKNYPLTDEEKQDIYYESKREVIREFEEEIKRANEIRKSIKNVKNLSYRKILFKRYIDRVPFDKIAEEMERSFSYVMKLHKKALEEFKLPKEEGRD